MSTNIRTRWAAIGAAVAITLGAGGIGLANAATSSGEKPIFKPIEPCRLVDLRPGSDQVGPRSAPLGPTETFTLSGWGAVGECELPSGTTALSLNVTALNATQATFLTVYPGNGTPPKASSLNPGPGQPPTPNAVTVDLDAAGTFSVYNLAGNVNMLIDVVGYYDDHNHDDLYYGKSEVDAIHPQAAATPVGSRCNASDTGTGEPRDGQFDGCSGEITLGSPTSHTVLLVANIGWGGFQVGAVKGSCRLERNGIEVPFSTITMGETTKTTEESNAGGIANRRLNWAGVTTISGPATGNAVYRVACREIVGDIQFNEITLSGVVTSP